MHIKKGIRLALCSSLHLSLCLYLRLLSLNLIDCRFLCPSVHPSIYLFVCLFACFVLCPSAWLSIQLSFCTSLYPSVCWSFTVYHSAHSSSVYSAFFVYLSKWYVCLVACWSVNLYKFVCLFLTSLYLSVCICRVLHVGRQNIEYMVQYSKTQ